MTVGFISSTESVRTGTTDPYTFTVSVDASARGIALISIHGTSSTDHTGTANAVTIGGKAMAKVTTVADTATEPGRVDIHFLGHDLPASGNQTVSVDLTSGTGDDIEYTIVQFSGSTDLEVVDIKTQTADTSGGTVANPSVTLSVGGRTCLAVGGVYSGLANVTDLSPNGNMTAMQDHDVGNFVLRSDRQTSASSSDFTFSYTSSADDLAMAAIAVSEERTNSLRDYLLSLSPSGLWLLSEPVGCLMAFDRGPNLRHGTFSSAGITLASTALYTLASETSALFNGSSGIVTIPDHDDWSLTTTNQLSVMALINIVGTGQGVYVGKGSANEWQMQGGSGFRGSLYDSGGSLRAEDGTAVDPGAGVTFFAAVTMNDSSDVLQPYKNGVAEAGDTTWSGTSTNGTGLLSIGARADSSAFKNAYIGYVAVYPDVLTQAEVTAINGIFSGVSTATGSITVPAATVAGDGTHTALTVRLGTGPLTALQAVSHSSVW